MTGQGFWRALAAGIAAYVLAFLVLTLALWLTRPFVWAALYGEPYARTGPYDPASGEWLVVQMIGFLCAGAAGIATARRAPQDAPRALLALFGLFALLSLLAEPLQASAVRNAIYLLHAPLGFLSGAAAFRISARRKSA